MIGRHAISSNTSSPLFMKRQPTVSLQRATVSPGTSRGTRKLDVPCIMPSCGLVRKPTNSALFARHREISVCI
jgi:hypothetical protein